MVLGVERVEVLRVDEAHSTHGVLLGQKVTLAVAQFLVGHQGVVTVAHSHVRLQVGQLLSHLRLLPLQEFWESQQRKCGLKNK